MLKKVSLIPILLLATVFFFMVGRSPGAAQTSNRAGFVVDFGDGKIETKCITFDEQSITGYDLLQRSGYPIIASFEAQGAAICKIDNQGCPANDCFCQSPPDYWSYWHLEGDDWTYSPQGSSSYLIKDGYVDGWAWGPAQPPPLIPFDQVCVQPTATNTPIPTSTHTPVATATYTPLPTATPTFTAQAYPPPQRLTNTQTAPTVELTDTPRSADTTPMAVQNPSATVPAKQATPLNPRIVLPAVQSTPSLPTPSTNTGLFPTTANPASTLSTVETPENASQVGTEIEAQIPINYLLFGVLAASLFVVAIFQSIKRRK